MSTTNVIMPQMGESITEATITGWRKKVGDFVTEGETLLDISTAKVEVEIPSPASGTIVELKYPEGSTVPIDTVIATLGPKGAAAAVSAAAPVPVAAKPAPAAQNCAASAQSPSRPAATNGSVKPAPAVVVASAPTPPAAGASVEEHRAHLMRTRSTPLVRNMARELGIDLADLPPGSGQHGRITRRDLEAYLEERGTAAEKPAASAAPTVGGDVVPMSVMRRQIAEHMVRSRRVSPHAYTVFEVDFTRLEKRRVALRGDFEKRHGVKLTALCFILKSLSELLPKHPVLNASLRDESLIVHHRSVNIGVAVAVPNGLIVPVIRNTEDKSVAGIAKDLTDKANRARAGKLMPADIEGGTFTVTSPGQLGAMMGTPIISQPQAAILHIGAISKVPAVVPGPDGDDVVAIRIRACLTLGFDHRLVDGWEADGFMAALKSAIEEAHFEV